MYFDFFLTIRSSLGIPSVKTDASCLMRSAEYICRLQATDIHAYDPHAFLFLQINFLQRPSWMQNVPHVTKSKTVLYQHGWPNSADVGRARVAISFSAISATAFLTCCNPPRMTWTPRRLRKPGVDSVNWS